MGEIFRTKELSCKEVIDHTKHKDSGEVLSYEKATLKDSSESQILTLRMEQIPDGLRQGAKAVVIFTCEQQKIDEE